MRIVVVVAVVAGLGACVTVPSKIVSIGPDTYSLNMTGVGFATQGNTNIKALSQASEFCEAQGHKKLLVKTSAENGVYGWSPRQSMLTFQCLSADNPAYVQSLAAKAP
jgi:hypothetical protein